MNDESGRNSGQVRSLTRALRILQALAARPEGASLTDVSEMTALPPSTTHRLLTTLEAERFVRPDPNSGQWRIGVAAYYVGSAFARSRDTLALIRPYLRRLMEITGETSNLFVESDGEAICIGQIESRHAMRAITGVGGRVTLHASGAGKVLLAHMEEGARAAFIDRTLPRPTERTITDADALLAEFERIRRDGYAVDNEENAVGLRCVAAPIYNEFNEVIAAISISGPTARIPDQRLKSLGEAVSLAAGEATRDFGGSSA